MNVVTKLPATNWLLDVAGFVVELAFLSDDNGCHVHGQVVISCDKYLHARMVLHS